jgi:hypothetical protein
MTAGLALEEQVIRRCVLYLAHSIPPFHPHQAFTIVPSSTDCAMKIEEGDPSMSMASLAKSMATIATGNINFGLSMPSDPLPLIPAMERLSTNQPISEG